MWRRFCLSFLDYFKKLHSYVASSDKTMINELGKVFNGAVVVKAYYLFSRGTEKLRVSNRVTVN
jgi:hypothetical protein